MALAERCDVEHSALLRNVKILERRGLLVSDGGRGRAGRRSTLTPKGLQLLQEATPLWELAQKELDVKLKRRAGAMRRSLRVLEAAAHSLAEDVR